MPICELRDVTKSYGSGAGLVRAVRGVSLSFEPGEFTVLSGPSGSGKTTLLNLIGLLDQPTSGTVLIRGENVSCASERELTAIRSKAIGFVFQSFNLIQVLSALENVEMALSLAGITDKVRDRATTALSDVGLADLLHRRPNELSGGQQQRVAIARALVKAPAIVIADEPTANLDSKTGAQVLDLMRELNEKHSATFLFSTHDALVLERARRVVTVHDGELRNDETRAAPVAGGVA